MSNSTATKTKETAKPMPKTAINKELAARTGLPAKQIAVVLESLGDLIRQELGQDGAGAFVLPGLIKLRRVEISARPAGKKPNPFKPGEMMIVKAREAGVKVKPVVLKGLKEVAVCL
jgi:hypothetical protein